MTTAFAPRTNFEMSDKGFKMPQRRGVTSGNNRKNVPGPYGGALEVPREITYTQKMYDALVERFQRTRIPVVDQVRDFITEGLQREASGAVDTPPDGLLITQIDAQQREALRKLASQAIGYDIPEVLVHMLIQHAHKIGPDALQALFVHDYDKMAKAANVEKARRAKGIEQPRRSNGARQAA